VVMHTLRRREFLAWSAALLTAPQGWAAPSMQANAQRYWSAASNRQDQHFLVSFAQQDGQFVPLTQLALPERGHHIAINPQRNFLVSVARRPGTSLVLVELTSGELIHQLTVPADRHLYGHGVFSTDGAWFYTTENAFDDLSESSGKLVQWAVEGQGKSATLTRVRETSTGGVGPHELLLMPDDDTLVIANGGIRTHPRHDRDILNLSTMLPSLSYVQSSTGSLVEQQFLPAEFHQSSIRHLDVNAAGKVVVAMQFEGEAYLQVPLLATHQRGTALQLLLASPEVQTQMQQYVGSVRFAQDGRHFAATCPRGNLLTIWSADSGQLVQQVRTRDNCGVHATQDGFLFSTGLGKVAELALATGEITELPQASALSLLWDNHLCSSGVGA
jgi:uncharacterized protein